VATMLLAVQLPRLPWLTGFMQAPADSF